MDSIGGSSLTEGEVVSIDGKAMLGSEGKKGMVHLVSAWASANEAGIGAIQSR
jgi:hypothetical protein